VDVHAARDFVVTHGRLLDRRRLDLLLVAGERRAFSPRSTSDRTRTRSCSPFASLDAVAAVEPAALRLLDDLGAHVPRDGVVPVLGGVDGEAIRLLDIAPRPDGRRDACSPSERSPAS
jgi:hypothetical protein